MPMILVSGLSYLIGKQILTQEPKKVLALVGGLLIVGLVVTRVHVAVMLYLALTASIFYGNAIPKPITFAGAGLHFGEILLIFILAMTYIKAYSEKRHMASPMTPPIVFLFFTVLLAIWVSYRHYQANPRGFYDFTTTYNAARYMLPYAFFFSMLYAIKSKKDLLLYMRIALGMGAFVALLMVAQYILGASAKLFYGNPEGLSFARSLSELQAEQDVVRVQPPGLPLNSLMFLVTLYFVATHKGKARVVYGVLAALYAVALTVSFARHSWITTALALLMLLTLAPKQTKGRLALLIASGAVMAVLMVSTLAAVSPSRGGNLQKALVRRIEALSMVGKTTRDDPFESRRQENRAALQLAFANPVWGVGIGAPIQQFLGRDGYRSVPVSSNIIHNSYLDVWLHLGAAGLLAFAWLSAVFLYRAIRLWRRADELWIRCMGLVFAVNYVGWLIRSFVVMMLIHQVFEIVVTAFMWAMVEAASIYAIPKPESLRQREMTEAGMVPIAATNLSGSRS